MKMMEGKKITRRRGTPIPVAPPRVPTPMPPHVEKVSSQAPNDRCIPAYKMADNNLKFAQGAEEVKTMKMITPRMDNDGYFNYVAATAKKKKLSLMQSKLPKVSHESKANASVEVRGGKNTGSFQRGDSSSIGAETANSCARTAAMEARVSASHRHASRPPRGSEHWIDHVNNRSNVKEFYNNEKINKVNNLTSNRSNDIDNRQKFNQNKYDEYQSADRYKNNQNNLMRDDNNSDRYRSTHTTHSSGRGSCHRQNSTDYSNIAPVQNNGNQAALECFSPKYHHIRPQPRGRETPAAQVIKHGQVVKGSDQGLFKSYDRNQSALYGQSVRKVVHSEVNQVMLQTPQVGFYSESQFSYRVNGMPGSAAQASAAAAFFARAAAKLNLNGSPHRRRREDEGAGSSNGCTPPHGGFSAALQKSPPALPPALLRKIGAKEATGVGKVKVMLKVAAPVADPQPGITQFFSIDKRKKQVTMYDPSICGDSANQAPEDRKVGVAAPKMFAFDALFSHDDPQTEISASALTDVLHAVINGSDGCVFCFGHAGLGKSYTMVGTPTGSGLGAIPCAISWLFRGIAERRARHGTRFSVRASAVELCGNTNQLRDLLAAHATDSEQSPGVYLRDDPLFGTQLQNQSELRVQTAEKAAFYLDAAMANRGPGKEEGRDSHLLYTLHVYQYSVGSKGAVAGGRSRLHLIDLGNSDRGKSNGGISLSGLGNILLGIFNGQKHLPYRDHNVTHILKECLGSLTCHASMIVHVSPLEQHYTDTLTTVQLASRIHRMRRRKIKFTPNANAGGSGSSGEDVPKASSSEPDPSSSDLSADTVIYVGHSDDATDGEHPPVYIPNLNSGDNRCSMVRLLKGSNAENKFVRAPTLQRVVEERSPSHKATPKGSPIKTANTQIHSLKSSPSHIPSPKSSPLRKLPSKNSSLDDTTSKVSGLISPSTSDEQWIDGPRISKLKVAEARHFMKEVNHVKKKETWVDGPIAPKVATLNAEVLGNYGNESIGYGYMDNHKKSMIKKWVENQTSQIQQKKPCPTKPEVKHPPVYKEFTQFKTCDDNEEPEKIVAMCKDVAKSTQIEESVIRTGLKSMKNPSAISEEDIEYDKPLDNRTCEKLSDIHIAMQNQSNNEDDEDSEEMAEMPPALPLIQPLSSREVSMESLDVRLKERLRMNDEIISNHSRDIDANGMSKGPAEDDDEVLEIIEIEEPFEPVPTQDSCLQVTEEDIAYCLGLKENPLPEVDQSHIEEHPLRILSQENLTVVSTFTDSMSVYSDMERQINANPYMKKNYNYYTNDYEEPEYAVSLKQNKMNNDNNSHQSKFNELARLHELYQSRLAMANVSNSPINRNVNSIQNGLNYPQTYCQSLSLSDMLYGTEEFHGNSSIYSEPAYKPQEKFCENCQQNLSRPGSALDWNDLNFSSSNQGYFPEKPISGRFQKHTMKLTHEQHLNIAALRHPDGASNPNLREEKRSIGNGLGNFDIEKSFDESKKASLHLEVRPLSSEPIDIDRNITSNAIPITTEPTPDRSIQRLTCITTSMGSTKVINKPDGYDSGHDSTPRTSKHSPAAISRRAESGYDSVVRDSENSSIDSYSMKKNHRSHGNGGNRAQTTAKYKNQHDRSFCSWLRNPFTCKNSETDAEISDF